MDWVLSPGLAAEVIVAIVLVVVVPSTAAALIAAHDRRAGRVRTQVRVLAITSYVLAALVLLALAVFLFTNHVRIENICLL